MNRFFLHGMGGSALDWEETLRYTSGTAVDIPHGPRSPAEAVEKLIGPCKTAETLVGYSMGARLAILLAHKLPHLKKLILISGGLGFLSEIERQKRHETDLAWVSLAQKNPMVFWEKWYSQELFSHFQQLPLEQKDFWLKRRISINFEHLEQQLRDLSPCKHAYLLPDLKYLHLRGISALYIAGELDKKYVSVAEELSALGIAKKVILPGAGHMLPLEAPSEIAKAIEDF